MKTTSIQLRPAIRHLWSFLLALTCLTLFPVHLNAQPPEEPIAIDESNTKEGNVKSGTDKTSKTPGEEDVIYGAGYYGGGLGGVAPGSPGGPPMGTISSSSFELLTVNESGKITQRVPMFAQERMHFKYKLGTLKPTKYSPPQGYGGGMYGGMGMGMGGGGHEEGGYGGEDSYGGGTYGGGMGSAGTPARSINVWAYVFEEEDNGRRRMQLVTEPLNLKPANMESMYGGGGYGGAGYGMEGDMGMGGMMGAPPKPAYVELESLVGKNLGTQKKPQRLEKTEFELLSAILKQTVWLNDLKEELKKKSSSPNEVAKIEPRLKELLTEQYTTQLSRQRMEVEKIEAKVKKLKDELSRRAAAKDRVVEIQTGRMVLEAQGLLRDQ